ncbi:MAG: sodium:proton antiporter [Phycisphaerae bacterium]|nr:sodium:proton antiporter [Phycisphaerae bacterium]
MPRFSVSPHCETPIAARRWLLPLCAALLLGLLATTGAWADGAAPAPAAAPTLAADAPAPHDAPEAEAGHGTPHVAAIWMLPFALLLGSIALCPLISMHFWEHKYPWFAAVLGSITAIYYLFIFKDPYAQGAWLHEMQEYVSFIALLGALYIVSGGIVITVSRRATATTNTILLLFGALIANVVGTTGAAMLLIRPYIRINKNHIKPYHVVFFIFIVANCGGCLTPIGDPPLFMGYLKGVPFFWVLKACWPMWALGVLILLLIFFNWDWWDHRKQAREHPPEHDAGPAVDILGIQNFLWIGLILVAVFRPSMFHAIHEGHYGQLLISREVLMVLAAVISLLTTQRGIYERNEFTYGPIREVAILFAAIFSTMVPALNYLNLNSDQMPLKTPGQYYFVTGGLSAVLDNAPTYLVFLETQRGTINKQNAHDLEAVKWIVAEQAEGRGPSDADILAHLKKIIPYRDGTDGASPTLAPAAYLESLRDRLPAIKGAVKSLETYHREEKDANQVTDGQVNLAYLLGTPEMALFLIAISVGAVFFGACTYIGNGPNFMVKSIAESAGICMPSFFGYLFKFALPILIPVYVLVWFIFFVWMPSLGG